MFLVFHLGFENWSWLIMMISMVVLPTKKMQFTWIVGWISPSQLVVARLADLTKGLCALEPPSFMGFQKAELEGDMDPED